MANPGTDHLPTSQLVSQLGEQVSTLVRDELTLARLEMIEKGATGSAKDFETVFSYLLRHYGKVFVNNAAPDEIMMVLGLSQKDADAIVSYRKSNGSFADFDAIKKVPDIDVKTLEQHKDAVAF